MTKETPLSISLASQDGPNILFSYSMDDDKAFASQGHTFIGVALDNKQQEVHVFLKAQAKPEPITFEVSTKRPVPDVLDALDTLIGHGGHYATMQHAHPQAHKDVADARAALAKAQTERALASLQTGQSALTALLATFGVGFEVSTTSDSNTGGVTVSCKKGAAKVEGHNGFCAEFYFDAKGNFIDMAVWE